MKIIKKHYRHLHKSERHGDGAETEVRQGEIGNKHIPAFNHNMMKRGGHVAQKLGDTL